MRDYLVEKRNAEVTLVESGGGVFEITVDGKLAFSKKAEGRFPSQEEIDDLAG